MSAFEPTQLQEEGRDDKGTFAAHKAKSRMEMIDTNISLLDRNNKKNKKNDNLEGEPKDNDNNNNNSKQDIHPMDIN